MVGELLGYPSPAQRCAGELPIRRSEQLAANWGSNWRIQMVCELVRIAITNSNTGCERIVIASSALPRRAMICAAMLRPQRYEALRPQRCANQITRITLPAGITSSMRWDYVIHDIE